MLNKTSLKYDARFALLAMLLCFCSACRTQYGSESVLQTRTVDRPAYSIERSLGVAVQKDGSLELKETVKLRGDKVEETVEVGENVYFSEYRSPNDVAYKNLDEPHYFNCLGWWYDMNSFHTATDWIVEGIWRRDEIPFDTPTQVVADQVTGLGMGIGGILYYVGSSIMYVGTALVDSVDWVVRGGIYPVLRYFGQRSAYWATSWNYKENWPNVGYTFISLPVVNYFVPGYVPSYMAITPVQAEHVSYAEPKILSSKLISSADSTKTGLLPAGTKVIVKVDGVKQEVAVNRAGRITLPRFAYLPARPVEVVVYVDDYTSPFCKTEEVDMKGTATVKSEIFCTAPQMADYRLLMNPSKSVEERIQAMKRLEPIYDSQQYRKFMANQKAYIQSLK